MYNNNFVVAVKCNNQILREVGNIITLPFGSEYSILLKNMDTRTAVVEITVDGKDVLGGSRLLIDGNSKTELKGILKGNDVKNRFKFIEKTKEISEYRGDRIDDGFIRVEYKFEKRPYCYTTSYTYYCQACNSSPCTCGPVLGRNISYDFSNTGEFFSCDCGDMTLTSNNSSIGIASVPDNDMSNVNIYNNSSDLGITVKGSEVNQVFNNGYIGEIETTSSVIVLELRGTKENGQKVEKPKTVSTKITCPTCGKKSRSNCKYCNNCGTYLL